MPVLIQMHLKSDFHQHELHADLFLISKTWTYFNQINFTIFFLFLLDLKKNYIYSKQYRITEHYNLIVRSGIG